MDATTETRFPNPLVVAGVGEIVLFDSNQNQGQPDSTPWLKSRKTKKFMGKQDHLAVIASGLAAKDGRLPMDARRERTGIYMCVGYIPFERSDIDPLANNSIESGHFSMQQFSTVGMAQVNPLLTFRCLPNMPIFHTSLNLSIQGPYFIAYPNVSQFYLALEQATIALLSGKIDFALVGAVADQKNFLVEYHLNRIEPDVSHYADGAAFLLLETKSNAEKRQVAPKLELLALDMTYLSESAVKTDAWFLEGREPQNSVAKTGCASCANMLSFLLSSGHKGIVKHNFCDCDGAQASSVWRIGL